MPFIPHTDEEVQVMLSAIGVASLSDLFAEIPDTLKRDHFSKLAPGMGELELTRLMQQRAAQDSHLACFVGAGAYEHHIPAAIWDIVTRGEFYTAYTPYQAEVSQGTLQLIYEYQTMMANLTAMAVSNASMYDGATALAEAVLMTLRLQKKAGHKNILLPANLHPMYRRVVQTLTTRQGAQLCEVPFCTESGKVVSSRVAAMLKAGASALVINLPNFFGVLEDVDVLVDLAHAHDCLVIAVVNPMALGCLKPPGQWGKRGADIVCGEGQPLGIPLSSGGPYFGFLCTRQEFVRHMPGRIVGRTTDSNGNEGFVLTLQAREQHIRRSKATSNICTNQGLMVTAATIYLSMLGAQGLERVALDCHYAMAGLLDALLAIPGVSRAFATPFYHECVLTLPVAASHVVEQMAKHGILAGYPLGEVYAGYENSLLVCATETKTQADIDHYANALEAIVC